MQQLLYQEQHPKDLSPRKSVIRMASNLRLVVILLGFSYIISVNAVPVARTRSLMHGYHSHQVSEVTFLENIEKSWEEQNIKGRMDVELNDYPGSGANNRHTPSPH